MPSKPLKSGRWNLIIFASLIRCRTHRNKRVDEKVKRTADTYLSLGALVLINSSAPLPVLPVINYFRKLNNNGLQLIVDLPQGAMIKQSLFHNAWVYVGSNYNTYVSFYQSGNTALPERFSYNTIELKSGPGFEYLFGKYVILGVSGGVNSIVSARAIGKGSRYNTPFIKTTNKSTPSAELRISFLPF